MGMGVLSKSLGKNFYDFKSRLTLPSMQYVGDHMDALFQVVGEQAQAIDELGYRVQLLEGTMGRKDPIMLAALFEEDKKHCKVFNKNVPEWAAQSAMDRTDKFNEEFESRGYNRLRIFVHDINNANKGVCFLKVSFGTNTEQ